MAILAILVMSSCVVAAIGPLGGIAARGRGTVVPLAGLWLWVRILAREGAPGTVGNALRALYIED